MEQNDTEAHFSSYTCDSCGCGPTVLMYHNGTPCLAQCKTCMPEIHEMVARRDVEAWLAGGSTKPFGR